MDSQQPPDVRAHLWANIRASLVAAGVVDVEGALEELRQLTERYLVMEQEERPAPTIQDRIKAALLSAGRDAVYEESVLGADPPGTAQSWVSGVEVPAPLGGSINIEWERDAQGNLIQPNDHLGLEFDVRLQSALASPAEPGWPPGARRNLLMALCASPEYAAAVARQICAEQNVEALRHGHDAFKRAGLYCPTCLDLGFQAYP